MCAQFGSQNLVPTSSGSESHFKNIKRLMGSNTKRVDVFVSDYLSNFSGYMKIALAEQKGEQMMKKTTTTTRVTATKKRDHLAQEVLTLKARILHSIPR